MMKPKRPDDAPTKRPLSLLTVTNYGALCGRGLQYIDELRRRRKSTRSPVILPKRLSSSALFRHHHHYYSQHRQQDQSRRQGDDKSSYGSGPGDGPGDGPDDGPDSGPDDKPGGGPGGQLTPLTPPQTPAEKTFAVPNRHTGCSKSEMTIESCAWTDIDTFTASPQQLSVCSFRDTKPSSAWSTDEWGRGDKRQKKLQPQQQRRRCDSAPPLTRTFRMPKIVLPPNMVCKVDDNMAHRPKKHRPVLSGNILADPPWLEGPFNIAELVLPRPRSLGSAPTTAKMEKKLRMTGGGGGPRRKSMGTSQLPSESTPPSRQRPANTASQTTLSKTSVGQRPQDSNRRPGDMATSFSTTWPRVKADDSERGSQGGGGDGSVKDFEVAVAAVVVRMPEVHAALVMEAGQAREGVIIEGKREIRVVNVRRSLATCS